MRSQVTEKGWRVYFDPKEYRILLESLKNREQRNAFRLMAHSLRVNTVANANFKNLRRRQTPSGKLWLLDVSAKPSTEREAKLQSREVWLPDDLVDSLMAERGAKPGEDKQMILKVKRTIQTWIEDAREVAAKRTGNPEFKRVSSHDFRRYFATHFLYRKGVEKDIVQQLGGWKREEHMFEYLLLPDDLLGEELANAGMLGTAPDKDYPPIDDRRQRLALDTIQEKIESADRDEQREIARDLADLFDETPVELGVSSRNRDETTASSNRGRQLSLDDGLDDVTGQIAPTVAAKGGYLVALISFAAATTL